MQEETNTKPKRVHWQFHQIVLMLLPGIIFLTLFPVQHTDVLQEAGREILKDPQSWPPDTLPGACRLQAATRTGIITTGGMLLCAVIVSLSQPAKRQGIRKALHALGFMAAVNVVLCTGGWFFGLHVNSSLEQAVSRISRTPVPQTTKPPAPPAQKP